MEKSTQISPIILYQKKVLNLFVINFDQFCFFNSFKNYYLQVFLGECKSVTKENKMPDYITDDVEISSVIENILMKQFPMNKILKFLMKKILMKKIKYTIFLIFFFIYKKR